MARHLLLVVAVILTIAQAHGLAQGITGQWEMTMSFGGRPLYATLTISKNTDGSLTGAWGSSPLTNVRFDGRRLIFTRTLRMGNQELTMNYTGALEDGKIVGLMSSDRGEFEITGARVKPKSPALGRWEMHYSIGERDGSGILAISEKPDGTLAGEWASERGEHAISNVKFQNGTLTFDRSSQFGERQWESAFEGAVRGNRLVGAFKSQRGEMPVTSERIGAAVIGKWELTTTSDRGTRTRILTVYPDLTGRYESFGGEIPIQDLKLEGDQVTFSVETGFGNRTSQMDFTGTVQGTTLNGQITSPRGTSQVSGKRAEETSPVIGSWQFTRESQRGTRTSTLKIAPDLTATYTMREDEIPVSDLRIEGSRVSFKLTLTYNNNEITLEFKGEVAGDTLTGEWTTPRGSREAIGKRIQ